VTYKSPAQDYESVSCADQAKPNFLVVASDDSFENFSPALVLIDNPSELGLPRISDSG
jgi:hypothetical protein